MLRCKYYLLFAFNVVLAKIKIKNWCSVTEKMGVNAEESKYDKFND
jgi:hypothetical protein